MILRTLRVLALAGACGAAFSSAAAEQLRLEDAVSRALGSHPSLRADAATLEATRNRAAREGLAVPLTIGAELENIAGTGPLSGVDGAEATVRLAKVLELGGKRSARQALGNAEISAALYASDVTRIDVASRAAGRFIDVLAAQARVDYAKDRIHAADAMKSEVARWVNAARNPDSDLRGAEIALLDAELAWEQAVQGLEAARVALAASWGRTNPDFDRAAGDLQHLPQLSDFGDLSARLDSTPLQHLVEAQRSVLNAQRDVAVASAKPDLSVSLGFRRLEATKDNGLVMSVSVPLGAKRRSAYSVSEVEFELTALEAQREGNLIELRRQLFDNHQRMAQTLLEVQTLRAKMLPKAIQALDQTRRGFQEGRFSFLVLAQAQRTLFDLREREVESASNYLRLQVEADRMTASLLDLRP